MRTALGVGLLLLAATAGARADVEGRWVVVTRAEHARCLVQGVPATAVAVGVADGRGTVTFDVNAAQCADVVDSLRAFGVDDVTIDGASRRLLEVRCPASAAADARAWARARLERDEAALWDWIEEGLAAADAGSVDAAGAADDAARCRARARVIASVASAALTPAYLEHRHFVHGDWTGTLADVARARCPLLAEAAITVGKRATAHARLGRTRGALLLTAPEGWYVPGAPSRTLDADTLMRATVWTRVEDVTLEDLVDQRCPVDAPAVTRYTRYTFAGDRVVDRRTKIRCAPFSPAQLK